MSVKIIKQTRKSDGGLICLHRLTLPLPTQPGFYRQVMSWNSFSNAVYKNWKKHPEFYFFCMAEDDHLLHVRSNKKSGIEDEVVPVREYSDIWTFYSSIGWEYKKKKFLKIVAQSGR